MTNESEALKVIRDAIVQSELEWDQEEPSAGVFAIVCGWHEALPEVAEKFGWSEEQISRLSRLRANFVRFCHSVRKREMTEVEIPALKQLEVETLEIQMPGRKVL